MAKIYSTHVDSIFNKFMPTNSWGTFIFTTLDFVLIVTVGSVVKKSLLNHEATRLKAFILNPCFFPTFVS